MKPNNFILALIIFAATITTVTTVVASLLHAPALTRVRVCVRRVESTPPTTQSPEVYAGEFELDLDQNGVNLIVEVNDTTTPGTNDTRIGRICGTDTIIKVRVATTLTPVILPTVP